MEKRYTIPEIDGYEITETGKIIRLKYTIEYVSKRGFKYIKTFPEHELHPWLDKQTGYVRVGINVNGKTKSYLLHRLLAATFINNPNNLDYVNHKNGIKHDNNLENLEWISHSDNIKHAIYVTKTFVKHKGDKSTSVKYSDVFVKLVRDHLDMARKTKLGFFGKGELQRISKELGISIRTLRGLSKNGDYRS